MSSGPIPTTPPSGFRDFTPEQADARRRAVEAVSRVYREHGFQPIATSAVEDLKVLLGKGGGENEKLIFKLLKRGEALDRAKAGSEELADAGLRFDLTLPLARYFSKYGSTLPHPFKAFHIGPVWRAERAQKGRYREFTQCDVDVIGTDSWGAEVEVISTILKAFEAAGLPGVEVVLNDRHVLLDGLRQAGVPEEGLAAACVSLDKLDKVEKDKVLAELGPNGAGIFKALDALTATPALKAIQDAVNAVVGRQAVVFSPFLVRGFDYYTTTVFEFRHAGFGGSIGGGGRYDKLTEKFGGPATPACGGSIGFERLMLVLEEKGAAAAGHPDAVVAVPSDEQRGLALELAGRMRAKGLTVDVYPGTGKLAKQFKYAGQKAAPFVVIPDGGQVRLHTVATQEEHAAPLDEAIARIAAR
jgi:histidyl-tRNA synthetase